MENLKFQIFDIAFLILFRVFIHIEPAREQTEDQI